MAKGAGYYAYLRRFSPYHLRSYQSGFCHDLARKSHWQLFVDRSACETLGSEDFITLNYRLPPWVTYGIHMLGWITLAYYVIYLVGLSEAKQHIFHYIEREHHANPAATREYVPKYQLLYNFDRPARM